MLVINKMFEFANEESDSSAEIDTNNIPIAYNKNKNV
jgi:hypothetical protein